MPGLFACVGGDVEEVILATNPTVVGEATAAYLTRMLRTMDVPVSRLASGLPVGSDLEYADEVTLGRRKAKLRAVGIKRAMSLITTAKRSIGLRSGGGAARLEFSILMKDYDAKLRRLKYLLRYSVHVMRHPL